MSDVHNVLSPAALLSSHRLMPMNSFMESVYPIFGLSLFLLPSIFHQHHYCLFQRVLPSYDVPEVGSPQFCYVCLHWNLRLDLL